MSKIIYFSAQWCGPCRAMKPIIEEFETNHTDIEIVKIDADEEFEMAQQYKITSIPTFILLDEEGTEVNRKRGAFSMPALIEFAYGE